MPSGLVGERETNRIEDRNGLRGLGPRPARSATGDAPPLRRLCIKGRVAAPSHCGPSVGSGATGSARRPSGQSIGTAGDGTTGRCGQTGQPVGDGLRVDSRNRPSGRFQVTPQDNRSRLLPRRIADPGSRVLPRDRRSAACGLLRSGGADAEPPAGSPVDGNRAGGAKPAAFLGRRSADTAVAGFRSSDHGHRTSVHDHGHRTSVHDLGLWVSAHDLGHWISVHDLGHWVSAHDQGHRASAHGQPRPRPQRPARCEAPSFGVVRPPAASHARHRVGRCISLGMFRTAKRRAARPLCSVPGAHKAPGGVRRVPPGHLATDFGPSA